MAVAVCQPAAGLTVAHTHPEPPPIELELELVQTKLENKRNWTTSYELGLENPNWNWSTSYELELT